MEERRLSDLVEFSLLARCLSRQERKAFMIICWSTVNGELVTTHQLYEEIYGSNFIPEKSVLGDAVWVLVKRIKSKIGPDAITNRRGQGYFSKLADEKGIFVSRNDEE